MTAEELSLLCNGLPNFERLVETHISWVLLCTDFAYKLKKPLRLHFLDFSSLELRHSACQEELELNRRLEPAIYLEVLKVVNQEDQLRLVSLAEPGDPRDYAVKMKRLQTDLELDLRLKGNMVSLGYMDKLAEKVARFHRNAHLISSEQASSNPNAYMADFNDLFTELGTLLACSKFTEKELEGMRSISDRFLESNAELLQTRAAAGMIRDLHGDLHTGNIFAYPEPVIFDCIEFNAHFRQVDVLNEIAFLLMDLEALGKHAHAEHFLRSYLTAFPESMESSGCQQLLIWFKAYRANIRAKVNAIRHSQQACESSAQAVAHYLQLMASYLRKLTLA